MDLDSQPDHWHRVYLLAAWRRALYMVLGAFLLGTSLFMGALFVAQQGPFPGSIGALVLFCGGVYTLAYALRSRITLNGERITVRGAFREQTADRSEIEGLRIYSTRNGTYTKLILKEGRGSITFQRGFETDGDFDAWMHPIPNLDQRDREAILDQIAHDDALGATPEERKASLKYAIAWAVVLTIAALVAAIALNVGDDSMQPWAALALALAPVVVLGFLWRSPLLYTVLRAKADPRSDLSFVLLVAGFGLFARCRGIHLVSPPSALAAAALIALALMAAFFTTMRQGGALPARLFALLFFVGFYGYGLTVVLDTQPDQATPQIYRTYVTGKHQTHGRSTSYILELAPWGPVEKMNTVSVSVREYHQAAEGDSVCFAMRPGALRIAWYIKIDCTGDLLSAP